MHSFTAPQLTRRQALGTLGTGALVATLPACTTSSALAPHDGGVTDMLETAAYRLLEHEPDRATSLGVDTGAYAHLRGKFENQSPEGQQDYAATLREDLARVRSIDTARLDPTTRTSLEVVGSAYANALDGFALPYGDVAVGSWRNAPYVVIQNVGSYIDLPRTLDSEHPLRDTGDVDAYLSRLASVRPALDGELTRMRNARAMGVVPPDFLLDKAIGQMEQTIADATTGGAWVNPLLKSDLPSATTAARFAAQITREQIGPALERQLDELKAQRTRATSDAGMLARPHGEEWYNWALRASTTTTLTPDDIHQLGLDTLADIHADMDKILRSLGYTEGEPGQRMLQLAQDERFRFAEGDEGRAQIMAFIQERIDWIRAQMPRAFARPVTANLEVRRLPLAEEPGAPTAYGGSGSKDGSIPGKMWINLRTTDLHRRYDLPTLVHHETIPGHVWQGEYSNELPLIRSILAFNAFSEGWALYAEQLGDELGAYADNPAWRLGYLQDAAYRAVRLVVDTGMHAKGWSRERARDFFQTKVGKPEGEAANEIDRYCSWPGQACGYMVGKLEMLRQRERARSALGGKFDLRTYNMAVVEGGNVPLDVLAKNVDRFVTSAAR